jgi:hypothetical protein
LPTNAASLEETVPSTGAEKYAVNGYQRQMQNQDLAIFPQWLADRQPG